MNELEAGTFQEFTALSMNRFVSHKNENQYLTFCFVVISISILLVYKGKK